MSTINPSDDTARAQASITTSAAEQEIERRFNDRYVYKSELLPPSHYRSAVATDD